MKFSATDLSESLGISYPVASGLLTLLEESNAIKVVAKRTPPGGRGKKVKVFEVPDSLVLNISGMVEARRDFVEKKKTGTYTEVPVVESVVKTETETETEAEVETEVDDEAEVEAADEIEAALARLAEAV
jgi:MinD superfamily P-loop ATPase